MSRPINKIEVNCGNCNKVLYKWPYEIRKSRYFACNRSCQGKTNFKLNKERVLQSAKKARDALKGKPVWNKGLTKKDQRVAKNIKGLQKFQKETPYMGESHWNWKGDRAGYNPIHQWVARQLGRPKRCEHCGTTLAKRFCWANKNHKYRRVLDDWIRLCTSCHLKYDFKNNNRKVWNKGKPLGFTPKRAFKKEHVPWNRGKRGCQTAWNKGKKWSKETREKMSKVKVGTQGNRKRDENGRFMKNLT